MRIYLAGPLFTQAERSWNATIARALADGGHDVFLPQSEIQHLDELRAEPVFRLDVDGVRSADLLVAVLDGADPDSGTSFECGLAFALGIPILAVRTDFRAGGDDLTGQRIPSINLMLSQAASAVVHRPSPPTTAERVARDILDAIENLGPPPAPVRRVMSGP
ncbi:nucleoside 2-deoxyribosyltransferase [Tautonia plasticadhaerens]|uniref:Nucleoside 2-deoxyribosyltransferase n=1 Tax=Tautonia plasticadhaerens TaxID=2527974 RepID=A0A518GW59_9BACT|nr:nucleoside 2-deoxyribosyltransferase [Tautonia plasticadhaerens]QDV32827.1 Nucleoside 2-deoxyribosyltransferase [Tautonia plasticadhaerens]